MDLQRIYDTLGLDAPLASKLETMLGQLTQELGAERGVLMITLEGKELFVTSGNDDLNLKFPFSRSVVSEAMIGSTGLVSFGPNRKVGDSLSSMARHGVRTALCAPILGPDNADFGIIYFDSRLSEKLFDQQQLDSVTEVAQEISRQLRPAQ